MGALSTIALASLSAANTAGAIQQQNRNARALTRQASQLDAYAGRVEEAGAFEKQLFGINAALAEQQAEDAIARGRQNEHAVRRSAKLLRGSQRASMAAQGLDLAVGSAVDVVESDARLSDLDALTVRNNAVREAWGFKTQAHGYRMQGSLAEMGARNQALGIRETAETYREDARNQRRGRVGTLLSGVGQLFNIYSASSAGKLPKPKRAPRRFTNPNPTEY